MSELDQRLNQILPKITSDDFLRGHGIGNEIAFHIFDYPPEDELQVRDHIEFLLSAIGSYQLRRTVLRDATVSYDRAHREVFRALDCLAREGHGL